MVSEPYGSRTIAAMEAPSFNYKPKARKSKTLLKYSCEEIEERMSNGLCIFCEERDTPGHHDLKHKGVKILMIESDDQPVVTESDHKPMVEESLADSDELVIETVMKPDSFSESLEGLTSDLQVVYAADPKEAQNKSVAEENMSFSLGNNIEHMVGKKSQVADRVWEPGGLIAKPTSWNCLDKYLPTRNLLRNGLEMFIQSAETKSVNERKSFKVLSDLSLETWIRLATNVCKYQKLMSLLVKESRRVWERGGLKATFALAILTPPFDISFDDMVIQEMRKSCGLTVVGSASISMMRWLHMIELVCSVMIKLDEKSSLKNLEKFRSLEKAASDVNSLLNVPEPVMPCSRPQLVLGLRQLTLADIKFHLKHKWRSRLLESFSCLEITTDHIVLFPSCCMNAYSVREQETKSGYPVYQENHAHRSCVTMLKQCFLQILSQQNKQETRKLSFSDSATTDSGHPLLNNFKSVLAHSNKELSQVRVQHDQKLSLATRMFKCSPSICHWWRNKYCDSCDLVKVEGLVLRHMMQEYFLSASVWSLLTKQSRHCSFFEFLLQWKWYPPKLSCQACSGWFLRLWTWQKRVRFFSSRWLIFGERVTSPSCIQGQRCTKLTQPHVDIVICISKEMTPVMNTWSFDDSFLVTEKHKYNGNGATLKLSYLIRGYGDRDIMKLQIICIYIMSLLLFYGSLPRPPEFRKIKKSLERLILLEDHKLLFSKTHKPTHSGAGFSTLYNNLEQMMIELQSCSEYKLLEDAAVIRFSALRHGHVENSFAEFHAYEVFHLQRPPEVLAEIIYWAKQKTWSRLLNGVEKNGLKDIAAVVYYGLLLSHVYHRWKNKVGDAVSGLVMFHLVVLTGSSSNFAGLSIATVIHSTFPKTGDLFKVTMFLVCSHFYMTVIKVTFQWKENPPDQVALRVYQIHIILEDKDVLNKGVL